MLQCVRVSALVTALALSLMFSFGCNRSSKHVGPTLTETTDWMRQTLAVHNGQRSDTTLASDVKVLARLTANECNLDYVITNFETSHYDLRDIDPNSIKTEKIGDATWVVFRTRNFNRSVRYEHPSDPTLNYTDEGGGFSLDSADHAQSFQKALHHAVELCGGRPSTF